MPGDLTNPHPEDRSSDRSDELSRLGAFLSERGLSDGFVLGNVEIDRYDARLFSDVLGAETELAALARKTGKDAPRTFAPLLLDLFVSFYKMVPELVESGQVDPSHLRANRPFVERLRQDEAALLARLDTATDEVASALATVEAARRILEELARRPVLRDWIDRRGPPDRRIRCGPSRAPNRTNRRTRTDHPKPPTPWTRPRPIPAPPPGTTRRAAPTTTRLVVSPGRSVRSVRSASEAASREAGEHNAALRDWGLRPADLRTVPLGERLEMARMLRTRRMRDLADLLGRMRNHRRASGRRKVKANRDEVYDVESSGDIARVLPAERARAFGSKHPNVRRDFFSRLSQRAVPSYSLRTEEPVGRGPVIAMIDSSRSMNGSPMEWACAIALALAHAASGRAGSYAGARRVHAVFFNAQIVLDTELSPGERDVRKFLSIGTLEADGGTDYPPPITRALEIISGRTDAGGGTADLLLVTDGICELPEENAARLREEKQARGFKLVSVLVGDHARAGTLESISDTIVRAQDLARASGARDAAGEPFNNL